MNVKKLRRIIDKINTLRNSPNNIRSKELKSLAKSLGRKKEKRGKHDTYVSGLPGTTALPIPDHSGSLAERTALSILDDLERDAFIWAELLGMVGGNEHG